MNTAINIASLQYTPSELDTLSADINRTLIRRWRLVRLRDAANPAIGARDRCGRFADHVLHALGWATQEGEITPLGIDAAVSGVQPLVEPLHSDGHTVHYRVHVVSRSLMIYLGPSGMEWLSLRIDNVCVPLTTALARNVRIALGAARAFLAHPSVVAAHLAHLRHLGLPIEAPASLHGCAPSGIRRYRLQRSRRRLGVSLT